MQSNKANVIRAFLFKMNLPMEETEEVVGSVKERKMGYLFENMEKMDIQLERRLRKEAEEALAQAKEEFRRKTEILEQEKESLEQEKENLEQEIEIKTHQFLVRACQKVGMQKEDTIALEISNKNLKKPLTPLK